MSDEDLELLKFYHEEGIDCILTEGEEEKKMKDRKKDRLIRSAIIQVERGHQKKNSNSCFQATG